VGGGELMADAQQQHGGLEHYAGDECSTGTRDGGAVCCGCDRRGDQIKLDEVERIAI
jgi:hypothetical protein